MARLSLQAAYDQARQWLETNDLERAIGMAEHILASHPGNLEAYRILGESFLASRQLDRSQSAFERVLRSDPENIPAHVGLGITFERRGLLDRAIAEFEQALEIKPDMPELRSQLLRLYTEAWGSENAQLRLSRAGLARLYAKGHMLPQAIAEFRQVIADQPDRDDAKVALAETLWRHEQEDEAAEVCREILRENPDSLKANLILGYLEMSAGRPEGERAWRAAYAMDPYLSVARAMFENLPPTPDEEPTVSEWDEDAWLRRRAAEQEAEEQEQIAATRPMESAMAMADDSSRRTVTPTANRAAPAVQPGGEDDFLASLLALDSPPLAKAPPATQPIEALTAEELSDVGLDDIEMQPFSLAELGLSDDEIASLNDAPSPPRPADAPRAAPVERPPAPATPEEDESAVKPFSLAELGLTDDEIAGLESIDDLSASAATPPPATPDEEAEPETDMKPFSLAELGLTDDEIAGLGQLQNDSPPATRESGSTPADGSELGDLPADLQPFSFDELDLGAGDVGHHDEGELPASLQPFSLEESPTQPQRPRMSGLAADEPFEAPPEEEEPLPGPRGFSWQQPAQRAEPSFVQAMRSQAEPVEGTIFDKLKTRREVAASLPSEAPLPPTPIAEDEHLGLFSLDNVSLRDDEEIGEGVGPDLSAAPPPSAPPPPVPQEPLARPVEEIESIESALATGDIQPFSFADLGLSEEEIAALGLTQEAAPASPVAPADPPAPPAATAPEVSASPAPAEEIESIESALATGDIQPFSFADLGLSEEEIAALGLAEEAGAPASPPQADPPATASEVSAPPAPAEEIESIESALATGDIQPFSFADLGLSEEEITSLGLAEMSAPASPPSAPPTADVSAPPTARAEEIESIEDALATGDIQPFSFADLGLSEEEAASLGLTDPTPAAPSPQPAAPAAPSADDTLTGLDLGLDDPALPSAAAPASPDISAALPEEAEVGDLQPFSLADLGLSEDEVAGLDLGFDTVADMNDSKLGLTEDELAGLASGGDVDLSYVAEEPDLPVTSEPVTSDLAVERLIALGREQGFVDIADIIAAVENPEAEAERIEEIGQRLHEANIEIRDGDEIVDMDAEYTDEEYLDAQVYEPPAATVAGESVEPFSLAELGLSDEEIAMLGLSSAEPARESEPAPESEPITPFSLGSLGLGDTSDPLDLAEPESLAPPADEASLEPFSLAELGLSDEEIAMLGLTEAAPTPSDPAPFAAPPTWQEPPAPPVAPPLPTAADEASLEPFSLAELGLSDEEIAMLGLTEATPTPVEPPPPAPVRQEPPPPAFTAPPPTPVRQEPPPAFTTPPPTPVRQEPPPARVPATGGRGALTTGNSVLDEYLHQLDAEPHNHVLRLSIARVGGQVGLADLAVQQYRDLIKRGVLLDEVVADLGDLIADSDDEAVLKRLHRALGDAYSKQGRFREAVEEYSWTLGGPRVSH